MAVTMKPVAGPSVSHLDEHLTYQYNALGRRDNLPQILTNGFVRPNLLGQELGIPENGRQHVVEIVSNTAGQLPDGLLLLRFG